MIPMRATRIRGEMRWGCIYRRRFASLACVCACARFRTDVSLGQMVVSFLAIRTSRALKFPWGGDPSIMPAIDVGWDLDRRDRATMSHTPRQDRGATAQEAHRPHARHRRAAARGRFPKAIGQAMILALSMCSSSFESAAHSQPRPVPLPPRDPRTPGEDDGRSCTTLCDRHRARDVCRDPDLPLPASASARCIYP